MSLLQTIENIATGVEKVAEPVIADVEKAVAPAVAQAAAPVVSAVESAVAPTLARIFDAAYVDIRNELPALMGKLGVNTSDESSVLHATLTLVVALLSTYGPAEIRTVLQGSATPAAPAA